MGIFKQTYTQNLLTITCIYCVIVLTQDIVLRQSHLELPPGFAETVLPMRNMTNVVKNTRHTSLRGVTSHRKSISNLKRPKLYLEGTCSPQNRKTKKSSFLWWSTITLIYQTSVKSSNRLVILFMNRQCFPRFSQRGQSFPLTEGPKT